MPIDFPNSPTLNQEFSSGTSTWKWNGTKWALISDIPLPTGPTGPTGPSGSAGPTGPTGAANLAGDVTGPAGANYIVNNAITTPKIDITAASSPAGTEGDIYYDTTGHTFNIHNGASWTTVADLDLINSAASISKTSIEASVSTSNVTVGWDVVNYARGVCSYDSTNSPTGIKVFQTGMYLISLRGFANSTGMTIIRPAINIGTTSSNTYLSQNAFPAFSGNAAFAFSVVLKLSANNVVWPRFIKDGTNPLSVYGSTTEDQNRTTFSVHWVGDS